MKERERQTEREREREKERERERESLPIIFSSLICFFLLPNALLTRTASFSLTRVLIFSSICWQCLGCRHEIIIHPYTLRADNTAVPTIPPPPRTKSQVVRVNRTLDSGFIRNLLYQGSQTTNNSVSVLTKLNDISLLEM